MESLYRLESLLHTPSNLEHLHTFKNVPISMGCTTNDASEDILETQTWEICKDTGIIQLRELLPLNLVYKFPHNDGIGKVWENHDINFVKFIDSFNINTVLEIGAGTGRLGKLFLLKNNDYYWTGLEPNHNYEQIKMKNFIHIREWFDENYTIKGDYDAIIHSHVFEHTYNPVNFLETIYSQISDDSLHVFSFPNLKYFLEHKYTNALNFEHTAFLSEDITDILLKRIGFKVIKKQYYSELPCIFYACKKDRPIDIEYPKHLYIDNKKLFMNYINFYRDEVNKLNDNIEQFNGELFLFGGHIFSQFLIYNGLNTNKISCILDNSKAKQGKRLYGTNFMVRSPAVLKRCKNAAVILKAASYTEEIKQDILGNINNDIKFF